VPGEGELLIGVLELVRKLLVVSLGWDIDRAVLPNLLVRVC
jgi:hypothetical protein